VAKPKKGESKNVLESLFEKIRKIIK